jgi:hypothetical protein
MKRSREIFLWGFFLALCFWAGYLKGYLPLSVKQRLFVQGSFQILNAAPFDLPKPFLAALESEIGQKVEVRRVRNWDELQAQLVTKNGPNLLFAPAQWIGDLSREDLLMRLNPIQTLIESSLSPDFIQPQGQNLHMLPLFWTITDFRVPNESFKDLNTVESILGNKLLAEVHLFPDIDLMVGHLKSWSVQGPATELKLKDVEGFNFKNVPKNLRPNSLWEVPHSADIPNSRSVSARRGQALMVYGMMIPRNSANKKMSYRSLERLLEPSLTEFALKNLPLGTTLNDPDGSLKILKKQRSSELREFRLPEVIVLEHRNPEGYQELLPKYNFVF